MFALLCTMAVSYTHLDVYKRQLYESLSRLSFYQAAEVTWTYEAFFSHIIKSDKSGTVLLHVG